MDFDKILIEYGGLKLEEKEVNKKISEEVKRQGLKNSTDDENSIQLFRYFDYWKKENEKRNYYNDDEPYSLDDWITDVDWGLEDGTKYLMKLITERKRIRYDLGIKKRIITNRAIKMYKEKNNEL